jgi:hypothetical protein
MDGVVNTRPPPKTPLKHHPRHFTQQLINAVDPKA